MAGPETTAGEMLAAIIGDHVVRIGERVPAALADEPDGVHQLRTAVRRLRNVLAAFSQYVEPSVVGGLRAQLADFGDRLGRARDLEVRAEWCGTFATDVGLAENQRELLLAPLRAEHDRAHADLVTWSAAPAAEALRVALCACAEAPALANGTARPAAVVAREVLANQGDRVVGHAADYRHDVESAHELRKAARRLRHVADAVTHPPAAVLGAEAQGLGDLASRLQSLLGDHRDALLLAGYVSGSLPDDEGARAPYLAMIEAGQRAADRALADVPEVLHELEARVRGSS